MVNTSSISLKTVYTCEIWLRSTDLDILDQCHKTFPKNCNFSRLALSVKRFTLLRSPLGNKKSKDQYEHKEYGIYVSIKALEACIVLSFVELLYLLPGIKSKILVSKCYKAL